MNPTYDEVQRLLLDRWPETKLEPSLDRITAVLDLLGNPQNAAPVISLTGTNGKTSTSRMIDTLLRTLGLRTGRFTSPHLQRINERICIDGVPVDDDEFVEAYADVAVYADLVDAQQPHRLSFFELMVAMAYADFADAPVDAIVMEVGMGGTWDATNVADAQVAVLTPIDVDHAKYLGDTPAEIAVEKAGIIKAGGHAILGLQRPDVDEVIARRAAQVGAPLLREGVDFGVEQRVAAVGGQQFTVAGLAGRYDELLLPLHGEFQASNAAVALAAVETFTGGKELDADLVRQAFGEVSSPGRMEVLRRSPTVIVDSAHNPHGMAAAMATVTSEFTFSPLIAVVSVMADKDVDGLLAELEPVAAHVVVTQNSAERAMPATELAEAAADRFGADRVTVERRLDDALERAIALTETLEGYDDSVGSGGVLVVGSVVTAGEARTLLGGAPA